MSVASTLVRASVSAETAFLLTGGDLSSPIDGDDASNPADLFRHIFAGPDQYCVVGAIFFPAISNTEDA